MSDIRKLSIVTINAVVEAMDTDKGPLQAERIDAGVVAWLLDGDRTLGSVSITKDGNLHLALNREAKATITQWEDPAIHELRHRKELAVEMWLEQLGLTPND